MVKVLMVSNNLRMNGISSVIMNYIRNIDLTNLQIDIFAGSPINENYAKELEEYGCHVFKQKNRKEYPLEYYINLVSVILNNKYDCIHIHTNSCTCILELLIAKICGIKKRIAHCHNTSCNHKMFHKIAYPLFSRLYTSGLACSKEAGKHLFKTEDFVVLKNGIDVSVYSFNPKARIELRKKLGIKDEEIVIGHVGLFNEQKNQMFLIDVFNDLYNENNKLYLIFVGVGKKQEEIKEKVNELKIDNNVIFLNERQDVNEIYNVFDCFCFPSLYEGLGIVMLEAQANGLPCLASTGVPETTKFSNQLQYLPLKKEIWLSALKEMKHDDREINSKASCIALLSAGYDIQSNANKLKEIYEGQ